MGILKLILILSSLLRDLGFWERSYSFLWKKKSMKACLHMQQSPRSQDIGLRAVLIPFDAVTLGCNQVSSQSLSSLGMIKELPSSVVEGPSSVIHR